MDTVAQYEFFKYARDKAMTKLFARSFAQLGPGTLIRLPTRIGGAENIRLGRGNHIGPNCWLASIYGGRLTMGNACYLPGSCTIAAYHEIEIGDDVMIGRNVFMMDCHHKTDDPDVAIRHQGYDREGPIRIRDGAWIGVGAVIMPGVTIGRNAVVGSNAVVTADVPDLTTVVGVPAKAVKTASAVV